MNRAIISDVERSITTRMSANIVADLLKLGISLPQMARAMQAPVDFLRRVQKKLHSFTYRDVKRLAKLADTTPQLLLFNSLRPVPTEMKEVFRSTREMLDVAGSVDSRFRRKTKKRGERTKAA